ncbi:MAG: hypothetical protein KJ000_23910 [Pirellulaceae bacterium]|nr:hypothetical protein [Pirellulaceae bacterium]
MTKDTERARFLAKLCEGREGIDMQAVQVALVRLAADLASKPDAAPEHETSTPSAAELLAAMPSTAKAEAQVMLEDPYLLRQVIDDVNALGVAGERELVATVYLIGVSRLLDNPLAAIVQGHTSSGKSFVIDTAARCFPPEAVLQATQLTPQALFYMPPGSLRHKFVIVGERSRLEDDDTAEATRALREMLSAGRLSKLLPVKDGARLITELVQQDGPIAYIESTTLTTIFEEDLNRCLLVATDDRQEQTRRVVEKVAERFSGASGGDLERIVLRHHAAQRMLQQRPVIVPFAKSLGELFGSDRVEVRRAFPRLLGAVQAVALLHQRQRQLDGDGRIIATADDYQIARRLLAKPFSRQLGGGISDSAMRFMSRLSWPVGQEFTTSEAFDRVKKEFSRRAVTGWLIELADVGVLQQVELGKGSRPAKWKRTGTDPDEVAVGRGAMPDVGELFPESAFRHSDGAHV